MEIIMYASRDVSGYLIIGSSTNAIMQILCCEVCQGLGGQG